jgi:iron complex outermembrane receptor protein
MYSAQASAQTTPATEVSAPAQNSVVLESVVVTAQRRSEDVQTVPITVQVFTAKEIADLGVKSTSDLAEFTPNVDIALPSGAGNQPIISIRGIGLNDYDTNNAGPNGVYLDEVYLSSPSSQTFQTFDLDHIEILKGPQGTLYGRNTSGGAINFVSAKPTDQLDANLHLEYGSFNTANLEGAIGGQIAPAVDGRIAFVVNESDGFMHNALTGTNENGANNFAVRTMLQFAPADALTLLWNVHYGYVNNRPTQYRHIGDLDPSTGAQCGVARTYAGNCVDLFGYGTPPGFYDGAFHRTGNLLVHDAGTYLRADYTPGAIHFTSISSVQYDDKFLPEDTDASPYNLVQLDYGVRSTNISQELRAGQDREHYNWVGGLYYLSEDLHQNQPGSALFAFDQFFGPGAGDGVAFNQFDRSHQLTDSYAAFGQGEYSLTDQLKLILGGRYTSEHKSFDYDGSIQYQDAGEGNFGPIVPLVDSRQQLRDSAFSWRAGLNYDLTADIMAYGSVATGFKSGDFNGSFLSQNPDEIQRQLAPVLPEKVTAYEIGLKSSLFERRLTFDAAAFYNVYRDMQVFVYVPPVAGGSGLPLNVLDNAPRAHTDGLDLQVTARPAAPLTAALLVGVLQTRLDSYVSYRDPSQPDYSGNQLPLAPHLSTSFRLDYKLHLGAGDVDLQANANYKSRVFFDVSNSPYLEQQAYWIENIRAAYAFDASHLEIAAFVRNLSGKEYYNYKFDLTNPFGLIQGVVGEPRTAGAELSYRY